MDGTATLTEVIISIINTSLSLSSIPNWWRLFTDVSTPKSVTSIAFDESLRLMAQKSPGLKLPQRALPKRLRPSTNRPKDSFPFVQQVHFGRLFPLHSSYYIDKICIFCLRRLVVDILFGPSSFLPHKLNIFGYSRPFIYYTNRIHWK